MQDVKRLSNRSRADQVVVSKHQRNIYSCSQRSACSRPGEWLSDQSALAFLGLFGWTNNVQLLDQCVCESHLKRKVPIAWQQGATCAAPSLAIGDHKNHRCVFKACKEDNKLAITIYNSLSVAS